MNTVAHPESSVVAALGCYIAAAREQPLSEDAEHHATRALVDWAGAMIAGWRYPPAEMLQASVREELGRGAAEVYGSPAQAASARTAALLNGAASHVVEMDDIYAPALYHPGSPTIAAALAAAQSCAASGARLLRAIVIGYEVGNRIGAAVQPAHYRYWHTTGTVGFLGAAAAAAAAYGLTAQQSAEALATAATMAAGLQQAFRSDSMSKPLHAGRAAEGGVFAARTAAAGFTGERAMLEGPVGFGAAMSAGVDWRAAVADLGVRPTIAAITHKNHACCGHAFAAIDGGLALRDAAGPPEAIRRIVVETYSTAVEVAGIADPSSPFEAKFSIPFAVATALIHGRVRLEAFTPQRVADARLRSLLNRVELRVAETYDRTFPALRGATVSIETGDGRLLRHEQLTRRGSPSYPMSDQDLDDKFLELASPSLGGEGAARLLGRLREMPASPDARLRAAPAPETATGPGGEG